MKFISSTLLTVTTVLPLIAAQTLNKPLHVIIATDWDSGIVSIEDGPVITIPDDAPLMIPIDVGGHTKDYRQVHEYILNEVDRDQVKRFSFSRLVDQQASTVHVSPQDVSPIGLSLLLTVNRTNLPSPPTPE